MDISSNNQNRNYNSKNNGAGQFSHIETAHRRVFTEGPYKNTYSMNNDTNDEEGDQISQLEDEENGKEGEDGVPIYSNSGVAQLMDH